MTTRQSRRRLAALEARHGAQPTGAAWTVAAWEAERQAHAGESADAWLGRMTGPANLEHWPAERRASMARLYESTAELQRMIEKGEV